MKQALDQQPPLVDLQLCDLCPFCHYKHRLDEGSSEMDEDGLVRFWCARCGKEYRWRMDAGQDHSP